MVKEHPILFSTAMIRAIVAGEKKVTRRVVNPQPIDHHWRYIPGYNLDSRLMDTTKGLCVKFTHWLDDRSDEPLWIKSPYGKPGDILWVKENCRFHSKYDDTPPSEIPVGEVLSYCADEDENVSFQGKIRPSIFMLRWASRITLRITNVRVERLNDIGSSDAKQEGITDPWPEYVGVEPDGGPIVAWNYIDPFRKLWDSINGKPRKGGIDISWGANPFVWIIEFDKVD